MLFDLKISWTVPVEVLKRNVALETVQNRAARALANLAMDSEGSALIHSSGRLRNNDHFNHQSLHN